MKVKVVHYRHVRGVFIPDSDGSNTGLLVPQGSFVPAPDNLRSFRVERDVELPDEVVEKVRSIASNLEAVKKALVPLLS